MQEYAEALPEEKRLRFESGYLALFYIIQSAILAVIVLCMKKMK